MHAETCQSYEPDIVGGVTARHWHRLADGRLQCDVCPRECKLQDGQRGLCFVRARHGDDVVLTTWGRSSGFCIDPIEKKPLNHFLPGTPVLSFGTAGCNLTCKFCQNWDISKAREFDRLTDLATPAAIAETAQRHGCRAVAFTYNDPTVFLEYATDVAEACRAHGIKTVAVTAGYINPAARADLFRFMDAANVDLKGFTESFYHRLCTSHLANVLETLEYLRHETKVWFEITTLLIPGENDGEAELEALTTWVAEKLGPDVPVHFSAFHPDWKMTGIPATPKATLLKAHRIGRAAGLRYVYTGNIHDAATQGTLCHGCGALLIGRDWYEITAWGLTDDGRCRHCGEPCAGVFDGPPGHWGRQRQPVRVVAPRS